MDAYIGSIIIFAGNFAPRGWALCQGQLMPISQNQALFAILGTTYGGNGVTNFQLPNLSSRAPIGQGTGPGLPTIVLGETGGTTSVTLTLSNLPMHTHPAVISSEPSVTVRASAKQATQSVPGTAGANTLAAPYDSTNVNAIAGYVNDPSPAVTLVGASATGGAITVGAAGSSIPFSNQSPYLGINYIIALTGIYPTRN